MAENPAGLGSMNANRWPCRQINSEGYSNPLQTLCNFGRMLIGPLVVAPARPKSRTQRGAPDVRSGSSSDLRSHLSGVRSSPELRQCDATSACPFGAGSDHWQSPFEIETRAAVFA